VLCKETHDQVIRLEPPLIIAQEDLAGWCASRVRPSRAEWHYAAACFEGRDAAELCGFGNRLEPMICPIDAIPESLWGRFGNLLRSVIGFHGSY
jgi:hypothetical protein